MNAFKPIEYLYITPRKKQITCFLFEDRLNFVIISKTEEVKRLNYKYEDITQLHLGLPDLHQHVIDIKFKDGTKIRLKSMTFFIVDKADGALRRPSRSDIKEGVVIEKRAAYLNFVLSLHERLLSLGLEDAVHFTEGNSVKKTIVICAIIIGILATIFGWSHKFYGACIALVSYCLVLGYFNSMISFNKDYEPYQIPAKYLPLSPAEK